MHHVETMAYAGQVPWHGIGSQLAPGQSIEVWRERAGMNWSLEEAEVRFAAEAEDQYPVRAFPGQKVLYRSDTKRPLAVVSNRYQVVQPREILEFYRDLTRYSGFELETAGVLRGGRKFWALARTGQGVALKGQDQVNGYLLLATACDGTLATTAQFTSVRVVCNNTLPDRFDGGRQGTNQAKEIIVRKDSGSYTATAKLLHWLMAAMWITAAALGVAAVYLRAYVNTDHSVTFWHKAIASALLFLLVARVAWRVFHHPPEMPDSMSAYMRRLAHMGHVALYAVALLALPMSGWVWSSVADKPIMVLGVQQLPL